MDWTFEEFVKWAAQCEATISFRRSPAVEATEIRVEARNFTNLKYVTDIDRDLAKFNVMADTVRKALSEMDRTIGG